MNQQNKLFYPLLALIALLLLAACGGGTAAPAEPAAESVETAVEEEMAEESMDEEMVEESMDEEMSGESMDEEMVDESMDEEMADEHMDEEMTDEHMDSDEEMAEESMDEEMAEESMEDSSMAAVEWLNLVLQDARTGDAFTLADFEGKAVYVEPMATWCTNCRRQLNTLSAGLDQLPEDAVVIGLSVEQNLSNDVLAGYANGNGYDFLFAVATPELIEAMVGEYGRSAANPPATPHFIIRPDLTLSELSTGQHTIEEIIAQLEQESQ